MLIFRKKGVVMKNMFFSFMVIGLLTVFVGCGYTTSTTNIDCCCDENKTCDISTCNIGCASDGTLSKYYLSFEKKDIAAQCDSYDPVQYMKIHFYILPDQVSNVVVKSITISKPQNDTNFKDIYFSSGSEKFSSMHNFDSDSDSLTIKLDPILLMRTKELEENSYCLDLMVHLKDGVLEDIKNTLSIVKINTMCSVDINQSLPIKGENLLIVYP